MKPDPLSALGRAPIASFQRHGTTPSCCGSTSATARTDDAQDAALVQVTDAVYGFRSLATTSAAAMRNIFSTISSILIGHGLPSKGMAVPSARVNTNHAQRGEAFSARLRALSVSQQDFAIVCGVTKRTVSNWAAGRHRVSPAAMTLLVVLEKRQAYIVKPKKAPRGRPFQPGNAYRFGDRRRRTAIAGAQMARARA